MAKASAKKIFVLDTSVLLFDHQSIQNFKDHDVAEGRMVPEFNDASFKGAIGKLQLVKTSYGFHIVEVLGRGERVVPSLAVISKTVKPSQETKQHYRWVAEFQFFPCSLLLCRQVAEQVEKILNNR